MQREPSAPSPPEPGSQGTRSRAVGPYLLLLAIGVAVLVLAARVEPGRLRPFVLGSGVAMCVVVVAVLVRRRSRGRSE